LRTGPDLSSRRGPPDAVVAASFGIRSMFAGRSWTMWLIDGGYDTMQFVLYGLVLGAWH
jgi:hypothetical protein